MEQTCHRCSGTLVEEMPYCPHCGAPQLTMNTYAQPLSSAMEAAEISAGLRPRPTANTLTNVIDWHVAAPAALQVALLGGVFLVLAYLVPVLSGLALLWAFGSTMFTIGIYYRRSPNKKMTIGGGARIGTVTGLFFASVMVTLQSLSLVLGRYVMHQGDQIVSGMKANAVQSSAMTMQWVSQLGTPTPQELAEIHQRLNYTQTPAGMATEVLMEMAVLTLIVVVYSSVVGAIGGLLMMRRKNVV